MGKITKRIFKWMVSTKILTFLRRGIAKIIRYGISKKDGYLLFYSYPHQKKAMSLIRKVQEENDMLMSDNEAYQIFMAVKRTEKIEGDIAEIGTYEGGSSKIICEARENKVVHLFDTFNGLPNICSRDNPKQFHKGKYSASFENIKDYLKEYKNVNLYKGIFPSTANPIKNKRFSFIHLDVDLYKSTLESIKFFYPRMNKGAIMISHDYLSSLGVKKAFDDFFKNKSEPIIEICGSQCLIVKTESDKEIKHDAKREKDE